LPLKTRLMVWTCAVMALGAMPRPAAAQAPPYGPFPPYLEPAYEGTSSLRLLVTPKLAEVYVDGRRAGKVEDYDGFFGDRLQVPAGGHELVLYLDGYRTLREKLHFEPGVTYKIKWSMEKLAAGESSGPRPEPPAPRRRPAPAAAGESVATPPPPVERSPDRSAFGTLSIRVQPPEATVLIDGERWEGPEGRKRLVVQVSEGTHRVEVEKDGYRTFATSVRVREGEVTPLNVSLPPLEPR
jgi:PEGA domain-containing protein